MRTRLLIAMLLTLTGCADEDSAVFNIDDLSSNHQSIFADAVAWWGGDDLGIDANGNSLARMGPVSNGDIANASSSGSGWIITFSSSHLWTDGMFCGASRHELGHVRGLPHSPNPTDVMYPTITPCY